MRVYYPEKANYRAEKVHKGRGIAWNRSRIQCKFCISGAASISAYLVTSGGAMRGNDTVEIGV